MALSSVAGAGETGKALSLYAFGSYHSYAMGDVNDAMRATLATYPGSTADKDKISSGAGYCAGLRVWTRPRLFFSLEAQRLAASNSGRGPFAGSTYTVDLQVPATSVSLGVGYVLFERARTRLSISAAPGYYVCTGHLQTDGPALHDRSDLEGSGFGIQGLAIALTRVTSRLDFEVGAGYRYAKTTDFTVEGTRQRNSDGSLAKVDWSGATARAGLSVRLSLE